MGFLAELADVLSDRDFENTSINGNKLTENTDSDLKLEVESENEDETITAKITHREGEWSAVFHPSDENFFELSVVIADELEYWQNN